jgi:hypothetical protein
VLASRFGEAAGGQLGTHVAACSDLDGDTASDLVVSAPYLGEGPGATGRGVVYVLRGHTDLQTLHAFRGAEPLGNTGFYVSCAGDLDGDGRTDVASGAPQLAGSIGRAWVGSGRTGQVLWQRDGARAGGQYGRAILLVGDVNGDGVEDIAVGSPTATVDGVPRRGAAEIRSGRTDELLFEIFGDGGYIHWPDLDEDLTVAGLLAGRRSGESPESLERWLKSRKGRQRRRGERPSNKRIQPTARRARRG